MLNTSATPIVLGHISNVASVAALVARFSTTYPILHMIAVLFIRIEKKDGQLFWTIMKSGSSNFDVDANFEIDGNWKHINTYADDYAFANSLT